MTAKTDTNTDHSKIPLENIAEHFGSVQNKITDNMRAMVKSFSESPMKREIEAELASDPEFRKDFDMIVTGLDTGSSVQKSENIKKFEEEMERLVTNVVSMQTDPDMIKAQADFYQFKHERIAPSILRQAGNSIPAQLIKSYRYHQLIEFSKVSDGKSAGFKLMFKDDEYKPSDAEKKKLNEFELILSERFFFIPNEIKPNFGKWLTYAYQDFFDIDKIAIEVLRQTASTNKKYNYRGIPLGFMLVDSGTIWKIIAPDIEHRKLAQYRWDRKEYGRMQEKIGIQPEYLDDNRYVQVDKNGTTRAVYEESRMLLNYAFGTTDISQQYQGHSVIERSLEIIRYIMDNIIYNYTRRSAGAMPKGFIHIEGGTEDGMSRREMALFRKMVYGVASGRRDHWKYPIIGTPKGVKSQFVRFHESSKEMEDFLWMSTLYSILCQFAGLDPESISLASQKNTLGKQRLFDRQQEEGAEFRSNDEGLRFFLTYIANIINTSGAIEEITGMDVEFKFHGLDVSDEAKKADLDMKKLQSDTTMNELLTSKDKKEQKLMMGDQNLFDIPGIANPQIQTLIIQVLQMQMQESAEGDEGEAGMYGEDNENYSGFPDDTDEDDHENKDYVGGDEFDESGANKKAKVPQQPAQPARKSVQVNI